MLFPIPTAIVSKLSPKELSLYISSWCSIFGDESDTSINSTLFKLGYIGSIMTSTPVISSQSHILEFQLQLAPEGARNLDSIFGLFFEYVTSVFIEHSAKHLSKLLSQLNGISLYNFLHADASDMASEEAKSLSCMLLENQAALSKWLLNGVGYFDLNEQGFCGAYSESAQVKEWWLKQSYKFLEFIQATIYPNNIVACVIGPQKQFKNCQCFDFNIPTEEDQYFGFQYSISKLCILKSSTDEKFSLIRPNQFCPPEINKQSAILNQLDQLSKSASLGYSVQNSSAFIPPKLAYFDEGCQLWIKTETDKNFDGRAFLTLEIINSECKPTPFSSVALELICDTVKDNLRELLYPSLVLNYLYDIIPSIKGETGITIHVSGPSSNIYGVSQLRELDLSYVLKV
ncbi:unnamed protein product [Ambrosiozyma monospora]|uniref:Unnamed protein product n=1 Tax=Ambrosiozyma monospora TaxID=43982 RepID=A0ACB5T8Z1_AMBMO|nr:unnamed protein product [Ambrosiozyma monospora]